MEDGCTIWDSQLVDVLNTRVFVMLCYGLFQSEFKWLAVIFSWLTGRNVDIIWCNADFIHTNLLWTNYLQSAIFCVLVGQKSFTAWSHGSQQSRMTCSLMLGSILVAVLIVQFLKDYLFRSLTRSCCFLYPYHVRSFVNNSPYFLLSIVWTFTCFQRWPFTYGCCGLQIFLHFIEECTFNIHVTPKMLPWVCVGADSRLWYPVEKLEVRWVSEQPDGTLFPAMALCLLADFCCVSSLTAT